MNYRGSIKRLAGTFAAAAAMSAFALQTGDIIGDVDNDGSVDVADLVLIQDHVAKVAMLTGGALDRANLNRSAAGVDIADYLILQKIILSTVQPSGLTASQLGLVINDNDPYSVEIGEYYRVRRNIPATNIVHLSFPANAASIDRQTFAGLKAAVDNTLPATVQALAIAWTVPSRVECNSMTSAFARGFWALPCDTPTLNGQVGTCMDGEFSPYYDSNSRQPYTDHQMRPAMMLAALSVADGKALIDRGVASDNTHPVGTAYVMSTSDTTRSVRATSFTTNPQLSPYVTQQIVQANYISGTTDALFYFQGLISVPNIATNSFPAGSVADHLTSTGGKLTDSDQMSALQFIAGGATGTFGTVSEPCALVGKFPNPGLMIKHYTRGDTLIEAYWKSVRTTFQGEFVGEPLANPWHVKGASIVP